MAHRWIGAVAQLGERRVRNAEVRGSTPLGSTSVFKHHKVGVEGAGGGLATCISANGRLPLGSQERSSPVELLPATHYLLPACRRGLQSSGHLPRARAAQNLVCNDSLNTK